MLSIVRTVERFEDGAVVLLFLGSFAFKLTLDIREIAHRCSRNGKPDLQLFRRTAQQFTASARSEFLKGF